MSLIVGYLSLGFLLYLIFTRFAPPPKSVRMSTENIEMMPNAVPQISGVSKRILFAQGWSQVGHGLWDPKAPKSQQKPSNNPKFDIKRLISILRVARYESNTLCCICLGRCYLGLETRVITKILKNPCKPINFDMFSWE